MKKNDYVLISKIALETPYSQEYLSLLVRRGKIHSRKMGKNWMISKSSLAEYLQGHLQGQTFSSLGTLRSDLLDTHRSSLASNVEMNTKSVMEQKKIEGEKWKEKDLTVNIKKELDELEKIYQNKITNDKAQITNKFQNPNVQISNEKRKNYEFKGQTFSSLDTLRSDLGGFGNSKSEVQNQYEQIDLVQKSYFKKTIQWVAMVTASILALGYGLGDFNFGFVFDLYSLAKNWLNSL